MMNFTGSDALAELVWSPQTGLKVKYAENKPCFMWEEGPSEMRCLDTQNEQHIASLVTLDHEIVKSSSYTGSQNQGASCTLTEHLYENVMTSNVNDARSKSRSSLKVAPMLQYVPHEHDEADNMEMDDVKIEPLLENAQVAIFEDEDDEKREDESQESIESCRSANLLTKRKRKCSFDHQDSSLDLKHLIKADVNEKNKNINTGAGANANAHSKVDMMNFTGSDALAELVWSPQTGLKVKYAENKPCFMWEEGPSETRCLDTQNEQHIASLATLDHEVVKSSSYTGSQNQGATCTLFQDLYENGMTSNVNDVRSKSRLPLEVAPMMQCVPHEHDEADNMEMDDVKMEPLLENAQVAIFEDEDDEKCEDESQKSIESYRSANFLTKRKRKSSFDQQLILGSKRIKKQDHEYANKTDHSFANWISNMLKGFKSHNIYDQRIVGVGNETRNLESKETGFQNVFRSLFSPETIIQIENKSIGSSCLAKRCCEESQDYKIKNEKADLLAKQVSSYEGVGKEAPKGMFDTIRRLRLSRNDIYKWMNSKLSVAKLDGFFLRLRVAKWEEGAEGSRYYVGCITGLQWETPWKALKHPIRVKVGGVECFVESQHVSNCDFVEDELIGWWQKTSENQSIPVVKDLKSKLAVRRTLGM